MLYYWNIIGHEKELSDLESDFINNTIHHAYLFVGPEKIGKFRVGKAAARILQCPNNSCSTCATCIQVEKKSHSDTIELEDDGESIKIGLIRDIIARLNMTSQSRYKILLIQNIGRLTEEAANCLLKTLEEPPPKTLFIFTASQLRDIMPTIASRMRVIHFHMLPDDVLMSALRKLYPKVDQETLDQVLLLSLGRSGRALQLINQQDALQELRDVYRHIQFLDEKASLATRMSSIQELNNDERKLATFLTLLALYFRRVLLKENPLIKQKKAIHMLEEIHKTTRLLNRNVNARLLLEHLAFQWYL